MKKSPLKILNGLLVKSKKLFLLALFGFFVLFFRAVYFFLFFFVVHLAATVATCKRSSGDQHQG